VECRSAGRHGTEASWTSETSEGEIVCKASTVAVTDTSSVCGGEELSRLDWAGREHDDEDGDGGDDDAGDDGDESDDWVCEGLRA